VNPVITKKNRDDGPKNEKQKGYFFGLQLKPPQTWMSSWRRKRMLAGSFFPVFAYVVGVIAVVVAVVSVVAVFDVPTVVCGIVSVAGVVAAVAAVVVVSSVSFGVGSVAAAALSCDVLSTYSGLSTGCVDRSNCPQSVFRTTTVDGPTQDGFSGTQPE
jgi:hypothetical protein